METIPQLQQRLKSLKKRQPKLRNRDLATHLGISEAELLTLELGPDIIRLEGDWKLLLKELKDMGYVMGLTRNDHCVHERKGVYDNITFYEGAHNMGVAVNPDIDLRFFMNEWHYGLAVIMRRGKLPDLYSFQFFNARGEAVHKVYSTNKSDLTAYHTLVARYRSEKQEAIQIVDRSKPVRATEISDKEINVEGFQYEWTHLQDTHDFFGMLKKYEVSRTQAFRLAPAGMVTPVEKEAVEATLQTVARQAVPIMCFVHSSGCIQIHSGPIRKLLWHGPWFNVMDPIFNLHLNMDAVAQCYIVRKPTADGVVTSLELFDAQGQLIVYFFGVRKPGKPELPEWRSIVENVAKQELLVVR